MNSSLSNKKIIPLTEKKVLLELISNFKEKESLDQLRKMHEKGYDAAELLGCCMEGVKLVGLGFEKGEYYISALIMAGEIMRQAAEYLHDYLPSQLDSPVIGHVLLGTIKGDIHDLGKNIFKDMLCCNGFKVTDLGVDVPVNTFVEEARRLEPDFVAMSCLLTGCLDELTKAVKAVREVNPDAEDMIIVGGSCLDQEVCEYVTADTWFTDAILAVDYCQKTISLRNSKK